MSETSRTTLKTYFETGDTPTEAQFINLMDSVPTFTDEVAPKYVKVEVSSAEILALNTTPKELVAAPGAGKMVLVSNMLLKYTFVTAAYATNVSLIVNHDTSGSYILNSNVDLDFTETQYTDLSNPGNSLNHADVFIENTALQLSVETGDPTAGDGTIEAHVWYQVITL